MQVSWLRRASARWSCSGLAGAGTWRSSAPRDHRCLRDVSPTIESSTRGCLSSEIVRRAKTASPIGAPDLAEPTSRGVGNRVTRPRKAVPKANLSRLSKATPNNTKPRDPPNSQNPQLWGMWAEFPIENFGCIFGGSKITFGEIAKTLVNYGGKRRICQILPKIHKWALNPGHV